LRAASLTHLDIAVGGRPSNEVRATPAALRCPVSKESSMKSKIGSFWWGGSYFVYGLAYGAASLSCTLPIFLAVVGSAFTAGGYLGAITQFLLYALGMGAVVIGVTLGVAVFRDAVVIKARAAMRYVEPASAVLLLLAGAYIIYYWLDARRSPGRGLPRLRLLSHFDEYHSPAELERDRRRSETGEPGVVRA
jgi:cytochrome c biogenesis DsbD-like protein